MVLNQHNLQILADRVVMGQCLAEFRNNVFEYYESLDLLHKLYEINIHQRKNENPSPVLQQTVVSPRTAQIGFVPDASLNTTEPTADEEFEAYVEEGL